MGEISTYSKSKAATLTKKRQRFVGIRSFVFYGFTFTMMSMRGFSCVFDSAFASSDLSDLFVWGWNCRGREKAPGFGTCLKSFVWERSRFWALSQTWRSKVAHGEHFLP